MKIHISPLLTDILPELTYFFKILGINKEINLEILVSGDTSAKSVGRPGSAQAIKICNSFIESKLSLSQLNKNGFFELENGDPDYISTAFFCLSSIQEFADKNPDVLGRFQYKNSYQSKLGVFKQNLVQECFDKIAVSLGVSQPPRKSTFFLSHDIDTVQGAIKEDGFNVLKKGRIDLFLSLLFNTAMGKPDWLNIDQIMKIESDYDCRSTFFWIMNKGSVGSKQQNADYNFKSPAIQRLFTNVEAIGFENGIHKSLSDESLQEEITKFGSMPLGNRYHYLKFNLPEGYEAIEEAGLKLDASLGFSEQWGFRNSYGLPFNPYNFKKKKPYSFVEVPLHIMDRTFFNKRMDIKQVEKEIFDFFEMHRENCVLSVLWHNNFFTDYKYKGYLSLYKKILGYIHENKFGTINQEEIIKKYSMSWP